MQSRVDVAGPHNPKLFALTLVWALLVFAAVHGLDFPGSVVDFVRASGGGTLLDLQPSFSEAEIHDRLQAYGAAGRESYAFRLVTVDVLLPLSLLPFLFLLMRQALGPLAIGRGLRMLLLSLPLVYVGFDLLENASILVLLENFPGRVRLASEILPYLTLVKRVGVVLSVSIPLILLGVMRLRAEIAGR